MQGFPWSQQAKEHPMPAGSFNGIGNLSFVAQILLASLPMAALVLVGVLLFFWMFWDHKRRLMIIARGGVPPPHVRPERLTLTGFILLFVGAAIIFFFGVTQGAGQPMLIGVVPAAVGAAIVVYQRLARGAQARDRDAAVRDRGGA
jgi:Flp pilus assembly protein TadB